MKLRRSIVLLFVFSSFTFCNYSNAASFEKYAPKLLKFEGSGYGIHKPVWGEKDFSKSEALRILRKEYWDRYHGDLFRSQAVAEVFIDHMINAGPGKYAQNIKAFEAIIGVTQDGTLSEEDVLKANCFYFDEQLVNPYVKYRVLYYKSRPNSSEYPGWITRATAFMVRNPYGLIELKDVRLPDSLRRKFQHIKL